MRRDLTRSEFAAAPMQESEMATTRSAGRVPPRESIAMLPWPYLAVMRHYAMAPGELILHSLEPGDAILPTS
jgi:hypothetical protein